MRRNRPISNTIDCLYREKIMNTYSILCEFKQLMYKIKCLLTLLHIQFNKFAIML